jgi:hypothetical protein
MAISITDNPVANSAHQLARCPAVTGDRYAKRPAGQTPEGADAAPKPHSATDQPDRPPMRPHPAASTDDPLRRLPESADQDRQRNRARRSLHQEPAPSQVPQPAASIQTARTPYDPPPLRQRDLDVMA